jgi:hypothetical protein
MTRLTIPSPIQAVCALLALLLAVCAPARADIAPPQQPPGSNITPTGKTSVAMRAEFVEIDIQAIAQRRGGRSGLAGDSTLARVTATFTMTNHSAADERMAVRFPLNAPDGESDGFGRYPDIQAFAASVNGRGVPARIVRREAFQPKRGDPVINWSVFDVTFPAKQDTVVRVSYTLSATGYSPEASFNYVLQTGAGWRDAIGQATIVVRLPYRITQENFFIERAERPQLAELRGNAVRWVYRDLEPGPKDDIHFTVIEPRAWQDILTARAAVDGSPNDGARHLALARAYHRAVLFKYEASAFTAQFVEPAKTHFRAAARLLPGAVAPRVELASALLLWGFNPLGQASDEDLANIEEVIDLLDEALRLESGSAGAQHTLRQVAAELTRWANRSDESVQARIAKAGVRVAAIAAHAGFSLATPTPQPKGRPARGWG